jgi:AcrR family transcriptional regulator
MTRGARSVINQRGQALGAKGSRTRARIVAATLALISERPLRDLSAAEIAKSAQISIAAFYVYFAGVTDVFLELAENAAEAMPDLHPALDIPWDRQDALTHATAVIATVVDHNIAHYPVFRLRNHIADEGDERFAAIRSREARETIDMLARQIATGGRLDRAVAGDALVAGARVAGLLYGMTERLTTLIVQHPYGERGSTRDQFVEAAARIMLSAIASSWESRDRLPAD